MRVILILVGLVAILAGCVSSGAGSPDARSTPEPQPTTVPAASPASPVPSAPASSATEPTPDAVPPKPTGVAFDEQSRLFYVGDAEYVEITQTVTWQAPRAEGIEVRVYGVTECVARPASPEPGTHGPCLVVRTPLPASIRVLLATAPASAGTVSWTWTQDTGCDIGVISNPPDGPRYESVVLAAYGPAGHSIFAIAEPGGWWEPLPGDMVC